MANDAARIARCPDGSDGGAPRWRSAAPTQSCRPQRTPRVVQRARCPGQNGPPARRRPPGEPAPGRAPPGPPRRTARRRTRLRPRRSLRPPPRCRVHAGRGIRRRRRPRSRRERTARGRQPARAGGRCRVARGQPAQVASPGTPLRYGSTISECRAAAVKVSDRSVKERDGAEGDGILDGEGHAPASAERAQSCRNCMRDGDAAVPGDGVGRRSRCRFLCRFAGCFHVGARRLARRRRRRELGVDDGPCVGDDQGADHEHQQTEGHALDPAQLPALAAPGHRNRSIRACTVRSTRSTPSGRRRVVGRKPGLVAATRRTTLSVVSDQLKVTRSP